MQNCWFLSAIFIQCRRTSRLPCLCVGHICDHSVTPAVCYVLYPQVSLWCVTALWFVQSVLAFLRLYHSHSQHISRPCRPREKELLLGHSPSDSGSPSPPPATPTVLVWHGRIWVCKERSWPNHKSCCFWHLDFTSFMFLPHAHVCSCAYLKYNDNNTRPKPLNLAKH